jgi:hypothetical protein
VQIDIGCRDAPFREYLIQNLVRRTEEGTRGNDVITGFEERAHRRKDRRHAGSAGEAILGPFEPTDLLDQLRIVGIGKSGIDISRNLIGEECACLLCVVEDEARSHVDWNGMFAIWSSWILITDGFCFKMAFIHCNNRRNKT